MRLIIRDSNGNALEPNVINGLAGLAELVDVEPSRVEGFNVQLSDDSESLILTVFLEEV